MRLVSAGSSAKASIVHARLAQGLVELRLDPAERGEVDGVAQALIAASDRLAAACTAPADAVMFILTGTCSARASIRPAA